MVDLPLHLLGPEGHAVFVRRFLRNSQPNAAVMHGGTSKCRRTEVYRGRASLSARLPLGVVTLRIVPSVSRLGEPLRLVLQQGPPSIDINGSVTEAGQVAAWW